MSSGIATLGSDPMPTDLVKIIFSHGGGGLTWNRQHGVWYLPWPRHGYEVFARKANPDAWQVDVALAGRKPQYGAIMLPSTVDTRLQKILSYLAAPEPRFAHLPEFLQLQAEQFLDLHEGWITEWQVSDKPTEPERLRIVWERVRIVRGKRGVPADHVERGASSARSSGTGRFTGRSTTMRARSAEVGNHWYEWIRSPSSSHGSGGVVVRNRFRSGRDPLSWLHSLGGTALQTS